MDTFADHLRSRAHDAEPWKGDLPSGDILATWRKEVGESQERLAGVLGVSRLSLRHYESGEVARSRSLNARWARKVIMALFVEASRGQATSEVTGS